MIQTDTFQEDGKTFWKITVNGTHAAAAKAAGVSEDQLKKITTWEVVQQLISRINNKLNNPTNPNLN